MKKQKLWHLGSLQWRRSQAGGISCGLSVWVSVQHTSVDGCLSEEHMGDGIESWTRCSFQERPSLFEKEQLADCDCSTWDIWQTFSWKRLCYFSEQICYYLFPMIKFERLNFGEYVAVTWTWAFGVWETVFTEILFNWMIKYFNHWCIHTAHFPDKCSIFQNLCEPSRPIRLKCRKPSVCVTRFCMATHI